MAGLQTVRFDTNVWTWTRTLLRSSRLTSAARNAIDGALTRHLSPVSFYEISLKVRLGKWPEMEPFAPQLLALAEAQGLRIAPLDAVVCATAGGLDWTHRDPFDRMIAATALTYDMTVISSDPAFDGIVTRMVSLVLNGAWSLRSPPRKSGAPRVPGRTEHGEDAARS